MGKTINRNWAFGEVFSEEIAPELRCKRQVGFPRRKKLEEAGERRSRDRRGRVGADCGAKSGAGSDIGRGQGEPCRLAGPLRHLPGGRCCHAGEAVGVRAKVGALGCREVGTARWVRSDAANQEESLEQQLRGTGLGGDGCRADPPEPTA